MSADTLLPPSDIFAPELPDVPYPGLRPFEQPEWTIFFGRERVTQEVIDLLLERRLVVVHGSSGCGKSSLIRAGVLSRLEQEHARSGIAWRTCAMRPGDAPTHNLAREFARLGSGQVDAEHIQKIRRLVTRGPRAVGALAEAVAATPECRVCLLIDQFEELFRFARETNREQAVLLAGFLAGLVQTPPLGLYAIITMRSEFLGLCAQFTGLAETINRSQYLLPPMERTALLQAIREPAALYGGKVDRQLAEWLITDAASAQDTLPLIQHALMLLWNQAAAKGDSLRRLGLDLFREQEGGIAALLSDHADRVMAATAPDPPQQIVVERLFRALTDINVEGQGIRRPQRFDQLVAVAGGDREALRRIIDAFRIEGVSFLTPYPSEPIEDATVIDISHEALIRCWQRIADPKDGWLQREFQDGLIWRSLLAPADSFEKNPKDVLSPGLAEDHSQWLRGRPPAWCERYGGGWQRVNELIRASETAASTRSCLLNGFKHAFQYGTRIRDMFNHLEQVLIALSTTVHDILYNTGRVEYAHSLQHHFDRYNDFYTSEVHAFFRDEQFIYNKVTTAISDDFAGNTLRFLEDIHTLIGGVRSGAERLSDIFGIAVFQHGCRDISQNTQLYATIRYVHRLCSQISLAINDYLNALIDIFLDSF